MRLRCLNKRTNHAPVAPVALAMALALASTLSPVMAIPLAPSVALADEVEDAEATVAEAEAAKGDVLTRIDELQRELDAAHLAVPVARENLRQCVRDNYKLQQELCGYGYVSALLGCDTIDDMTTVTKAHDRLRTRMTELVGQLATRGAELESSKAALDQELEQAEMTLQEANDALAQRQAEAEEAARLAKAAYSAAPSASYEATGNEGATYTLSEFKFMGVIYQNGFRYTYYSESVLPGGGLSIPGRHHENGFVCDGDGYICVASNDLSYGSVVPVPFAGYMGKVYDCGCASGTIDIYVA